MLTEKEIKRATELAKEGIILLDGKKIKAMRAANRASCEFIPLTEKLTPALRKELQKLIKGEK